MHFEGFCLDASQQEIQTCCTSAVWPQRAAVRRMLAMETGRGLFGTSPSHPFIRQLVTQSGLPIFANLVSCVSSRTC